MKATPTIRVTGARENNLKDISLTLSPGKLLALTGPSGSGKTSLAIDTIYDESRYRSALLLALSQINRRTPHSRVPVVRKPRVDRIQNLPPVIALTGRERVAPTASIGSFLDLDVALSSLLLRKGARVCIQCGTLIEGWNEDELISSLGLKLKTPRKDEVLAITAIVTIPGEKLPEAPLQPARAHGFSKVILGDTLYDLDSLGTAELQASSTDGLEIVVDRLTTDSNDPERIQEALRTARQYGSGKTAIRRGTTSNTTYRLLKISGESGICTGCNQKPRAIKAAHFDLRITPGSNTLASRYRFSSDVLSQAFSTGISLRNETLIFSEMLTLSNSDLLEAMSRCVDAVRNDPSFIVLKDKLTLLIKLDLSHLTLTRPLSSLSRGEGYRLKLASSLLSATTRSFFVIDEPSSGLHPADTKRISEVLRELRDQGNTVLFIEHNPLLLSAADHVIAFGPGSGSEGGRIISEGDFEAPQKVVKTLTDSGEKRTAPVFSVTGARKHNLRGIGVSFPLNRFSCVTGVSGSGKSSLVMGSILPAITCALEGCSAKEISARSEIEAMKGHGNIKAVVASVSPQRFRNSRSIVASYTGVFSSIRNLMADMTLARMRGLTRKNFGLTSSNPSLCCRCKGTGLAIHSGPGIQSEDSCPKCQGKRFSKDILDIRFRGHNISDLLELTFKDSRELLVVLPGCNRVWDLMEHFNLGHLQLGQPTASLSKGEMQRVRMIRDLNTKRSHTLYLFDELSSGLGEEEVLRIASAIHALCKDGENTVIAIDHNPALISVADHIVDLGPGAGSYGGRIVAEGSVNKIIDLGTSLTGSALRDYSGLYT